MSPDLYQRQYNKSLLKVGLDLRDIFYHISEIAGSFIFGIARIYHLRRYLSPGKINRSSHKILAIRTDRIGDLILSTPALHALREGFPGAEIWLLVEEKNQALVKNNPDLDRVINYRRKQGLKRYLQLIKQLRKAEFAVTVVMYPSFRWHLVALLTGAPYRYGYRAKGAGFLLTHPLRDTRFSHPRHEVETTLDLIRAMDIPVTDKRLRIYITDEAIEGTARFLEECRFDKTRPLVAIHPGSHAPRVRWAIEDFAQLADMLVARYRTNIIIVGSEEETNLSRRLSNLMKSQSINACGRIGLQELAALLNRCHLFIGNSSGPMHLAAAVGTPTIAIFGNIYPLDSYRRWRPWSEQAITLHKDVGCSDCLPWSCRDMVCMKAITPEDVLPEADRFLKSPRPLRAKQSTI